MKHPKPVITDHASVLDTLALAREMHPGQRNTLDALCKRYEVDASKRDVHGALIDADLLARVYLAMTGGQTALSLDAARQAETSASTGIGDLPSTATWDLPVVRASAEESAAHEALLAKLREQGECVWDGLETA